MVWFKTFPFIPKPWWFDLNTVCFISKSRWPMTFHLKSTSRFISNVWWFQTIHFIPKVLLNLRHVVSPQDVLRQFVSSQEYDGFRQFVSSQSIVVFDISFHLKVWWFMTVRFISFPTHVTSVYALWATRAADSHGLAVKDPNVHVSAVVTLKGLAMYAIIIGRFWIEGASALVPPTPFYGGGQGDKQFAING